ncbi:MAG: ATP-binding protein [Bradyrhizobium sp.]|nr:ATP-binding protein [Bradyrhizobium sp.]
MTLPSTIRTAVSQAAITKVTRLFNGSVGDVLNELLQNARRAGASRIDIETLDLAGHPTLNLRDDGRGIAFFQIHSGHCYHWRFSRDSC